MYIHFSIFCLYLEAWSLQAVKIIANSNYGWSRTRKEKLNHFKTHFIFTKHSQHETHITPIQTHQEVFSTQRTCNQHRQGRKRGKGAEKWRVMIYGDQRDAEPVSLISKFIVWRRKIFSHKKIIYKHLYLFLPVPFQSPGQSISQLFRNAPLLSEIT